MLRGAGLLVLAGAFFAAQPTLAQTQPACPIPAGATPPADPSVTAQQVEAGAASLMEFGLAATERFRTLSQGIETLDQLSYLGCLIRQEGSAYRAGSTYIVTLTPDGRILFHAKDMSLSGRLLNPAIYATILASLGVSLTDLTNLASPDPATRNLALASVFQTLAREPHGPFNATIPIPGLSPGFQGASGHASVYISATLGIPQLMLVGFDLDLSHVAEEQIDYGDPAVAAADVVDRETLRAFVEEAGNYIIEFQQSGNIAAASQARIALRDMNGPWRHGSVYLYVLDTVSNIILFHGAFPDRFELRPLVPTVRDAVTGELILPQVLDAARSSPDGGFVQYYFDDPTDATDNADIPKVGYAREFSGSFQTGDGTVRPLRFIVGSGFYLSDPGVTAVRQNSVIENVLPQIMRTMTASTVDAIAGRIQQANAAAPQAAAFSLGGASTLTDALLENGRALGSGSIDLNRLLTDSSFALPLNQNGAGSGPTRNVTLWGSADYRSIADGDRQATAYDGDVTSANIGVDTLLGRNLLGGVSVAFARGVVDYTDPESVNGELTSTLTSFNPYLGWKGSGGTSVWAAVGFGRGEVEVAESTLTQASDLTQQMAAAGISTSLASSDGLIAGGATSLIFKGETAFTQADVRGGGTLLARSLSASRHRLMLEGTHTRTLASGAKLTPSVEIGVRYDGGDGKTGAGVELGAGLGYTAGRLSVKVNARSLAEHDEAAEYEEWGLSGLLVYQSAEDGHGVSMTLGSTWGAPHGGVHSLWSRQDTEEFARTGAAMSMAQRFQAEMRYGLSGPGGHGLWLPYVGADSGSGIQALRMGVRLTSGPNVEAGLEIGRRETLYRAADHALQIRVHMRW